MGNDNSPKVNITVEMSLDLWDGEIETVGSSLQCTLQVPSKVCKILKPRDHGGPGWERPVHGLNLGWDVDA